MRKKYLTAAEFGEQVMMLAVENDIPLGSPCNCDGPTEFTAFHVCLVLENFYRKRKYADGSLELFDDISRRFMERCIRFGLEEGPRGYDAARYLQSIKEGRPELWREFYGRWVSASLSPWRAFKVFLRLPTAVGREESHG